MLSDVLHLITAWLLFPIAASVLCLGLVRAVHFVTRTSTHILLDLPLGFAALVVLGQLLTAYPSTATVTVATICVLAAAGLVLNPVDWREWFQVSRAPLAFASATYVAYLLPVLMTGKTTFLGWIKLDDGSTFMAFTDQLLAAGRTTAGLPESTFEAAVQFNFDRGYPMGAFVPLGVVAKVLNIDIAWVYQPYLAFLAALATLTLYVVMRRFVVSTFQRGLFALGAACSSLLVGYAWWGGIKELTLVPLLAMVAHFIDEVRPHGHDKRSLLPLALVVGAFISVFAPTGMAWVALPLLFVAWKYQTDAPARLVSDVGALVVVAVLLSLPTFKAFGGLEAYKTALTFTQSDPDIGNLYGQLNPMQIAGVWPTGDFRIEPTYPLVAELMVAFVLVLAALALHRMWASEHRGLAIVTVNAAVIALATTRGNAWIAGKSLAVASPLVLACAMVGMGLLYQEARQTEYFASSSIIGVGLVWSLALGYHQVWVAPYDQLRELELIGHTFAGSQPTLIVEYSPYGSRHFLRDMATEGAGELRRRTVTMVDGGTLDKGEYGDIDQFTLEAVQTYETLVLRRSPIGSRPPGNYSLQAADSNFEVWQKDTSLPVPVAHIGLGGLDDAGGVMSCEQIKQLSQRATNGARLVAAVAPELVTVPLAGDSLPSGWVASGLGVVPAGSGTLERTFTVSSQGDYQVWVQGWSRGRTTVLVDGQPVGSVRHVLNHTQSSTQIGVVSLAAGSHTVRIEYSAAWWMPGVGGYSDALGPVSVTPAPGEHTLIQVEAADFNTLCAKRLDWIEVAH